MNAKKQAVEDCKNCLVAGHINGSFKIGLCPFNMRSECSIISKVDESGLYVTVNSIEGDWLPIWGWENRPYSKGLKHAFHKSVASVITWNTPPGVTIYYPTRQSEFAAISDLIRTVIVNGKFIFESFGNNDSCVYYKPVNNPNMIIRMTFDGSTKARIDAVDKLYRVRTDKPVFYEKLRGPMDEGSYMLEDLINVLTDMFDMVDD